MQVNASGFKLNLYRFICSHSITDLMEIDPESSCKPLL